MSNTTIETDQPVAAASTNEPATRQKKIKIVNKAKAGKKSGKKTKATAGKKSVNKSSAERSNKKAEVVAMMKRARGATLEEITSVTGWQRHYADIGIRRTPSVAS